MSDFPEYNPETIKRLQALGLDPFKKPPSPSVTPQTPKPKPQTSVFPLLTISGLSLLSVGSLILFKNKSSTPSSQQIISPSAQSQTHPTPTQIPKSIHHYLLTSQSSFTEATASQGQDPQQTISLLNEAVDYATQAITLFPTDYRGFEQRAKIYSALTPENPEDSGSYLHQAIADYQKALQLQPDNSDITKILAELWAKKGSVDNTLAYLQMAIGLEPTKAQHYYDLAHIQTQIGQISEAVQTYQHLLPLLSDSDQKTKVSAAKNSLQTLLTQNHNLDPQPSESIPNQAPDLIEELNQAPAIQALAGTGPVIASPQEEKDLAVTGQTDSNALSGTATISTGQTELAISSQSLTSSSHVYTTITKGGKNQILTLKSKDDSSFTVSLDSPATEDVEFKWWITN